MSRHRERTNESVTGKGAVYVVGMGGAVADQDFAAVVLSVIVNRSPSSLPFGSTLDPTQDTVDRLPHFSNVFKNLDAGRVDLPLPVRADVQ